jgi:hypothetical protein
LSYCRVDRVCHSSNHLPPSSANTPHSQTIIAAVLCFPQHVTTPPGTIAQIATWKKKKKVNKDMSRKLVLAKE